MEQQPEQKGNKLSAFFLIASALCFAGLVPAALAAQEENDTEAEADDSIEKIVILGSRRAGRSVGDSPAPIDVFGGEDFENQASGDVTDMLRTLVPSYQAALYPVHDAATLVRPANLRGLPPDNTLVLVNSKRRHRGAVIIFFGAGITDGSQGPDVAVIPAIALKQVEVLRDGASAQYGSDAIAGVINFVLKDNAEGFEAEARMSQTLEGDGDNFKLAANWGLPLSDNGFVNLSFETSGGARTVRSVQRGDAAQLTDMGNTAVRQPVQIWGNPNISDDNKFFANMGLDLSPGARVYAFGNLSTRTVLGGFYFRNPTNRSGVFSGDDGLTRLVGDLTPGPLGQVNDGLANGDGIDCPTVNVRTDGSNTVTVPIDQVALANIIADPNCFVYNGRYPGGFTPNFGGDVADMGFQIGVKGETAGGLFWDISSGVGSSEVEFLIEYTVNASLGPDSPERFRPGTYTQTEDAFNADFSLPIEVGWSSPLNIGFGLESRTEQFEITQGDRASWVEGPLFNQGFTIGTNGFPGFSESVSGKWSRNNTAVYVDLESDITAALLLGGAIRFEDFEDFGTTTNGKISLRYAFADTFALRSTISTGFRAPTPGQANVSNVSTITVDNQSNKLTQRGTIPPTNPVAQLKGGKALTEESSINTSLGFVWDLSDSLNLTLDYFNVEVKDRITQSADLVVTAEDRAELVRLGVGGAGDFDQLRFYTNQFDTATSGVDLVVSYAFANTGGDTRLNLALNQTDTSIEAVRDPRVVDRRRRRQIEDALPATRWNLTATHQTNQWRFLGRVSYHSEYVEAGSAADPATDLTFSGEYQVDVEAAYNWGPDGRYSFVLGMQNLLDEYPDLHPNALSLGNPYPDAAPNGFNGGVIYSRFRVSL